MIDLWKSAKKVLKSEMRLDNL